MKYIDIIYCIKNELSLLENRVKDILKKEKYFGKDLFSFFENGKKIRSSLMFLILKALNINIEEKYLSLATTVELIHCASLIHDDIIDNAKNRRNKLTFNQQYGNSISVILGDYLFSFVIETLNKLDNKKITNLFSNTMKTMCEGEFEQHFSIGQIPTLQNYIEKSYKKTGLLFETAIKSVLINDEDQNVLADFAKNFGITFQLKDDFNNIYKNNSCLDVKEKIYTAPVIFANEDYPNIINLSEEELITIIKQEKYKNKTKELIKSYIEKTIEKIDFLQDNEYTLAIKNLCEFINKD